MNTDEKKNKNTFSDKSTLSKKKEPESIILKNDIISKKKPIIKTYRDFAIEALRDKPTSLAKMIIKEKKKKEYEYNYSPKSKKNILVIVLSSVLFILGIAAVASVIVFSIAKKEQISQGGIKIDPRSIIYFDYKIENDITKSSRNDIKKIITETIKDTNIPFGDLKILYFVQKNSEGVKKLVTSGSFLEMLDTRAPLQFIRNLKEEFSIGVISTIEGPSPFLVLGVNNFDTSHNFLLAWEKTLMSDISDLFEVSPKYIGQKFQDIDVYNKDVKAILDEEGKIIFGYSFIDLKTLVFFTNEKSFKKLISSFQNKKQRK